MLVTFPVISSLKRMQVTLFSSAAVTSGNYSLTYTRNWVNDTTGVLNSDAERTTCLDWNADAAKVRREEIPSAMLIPAGPAMH